MKQVERFQSVAAVPKSLFLLLKLQQCGYVRLCSHAKGHNRRAAGSSNWWCLSHPPQPNVGWEHMMCHIVAPRGTPRTSPRVWHPTTRPRCCGIATWHRGHTYTFSHTSAAAWTAYCHALTKCCASRSSVQTLHLLVSPRAERGCSAPHPSIHRKVLTKSTALPASLAHYARRYHPHLPTLETEPSRLRRPAHWSCIDSG